MALSKQCGATWSTPGAHPQLYGYEPQYDPIRQPKKQQIQDNRLEEECLFFRRYNRPLPKWWPTHRDGKAKTHLYRLIDHEGGTDNVPPPRIQKGMRHILRPEQKVDFSHQLVKEQAIKQIDEISEDDYGERPLLSFSVDLEELFALGSRHVQYWEARGRTVAEVYVRLDLFALWDAGLFTKTSFADISTEAKFDAYFLGAFGNHRLATLGIDYDRRRAASCRLHDFLIGTRRRWWPQYCVIITRGDAAAACQLAGIKLATVLRRLVLT